MLHRSNATLVILLSLPAWFLVYILRMRPAGFIGDDAYMTLKVARNLLQGNGLVYNLGEYVQVSTTLLWTLVLAVSGWLLGKDPSLVYPYCSFIIDILNCTALALFASDRGRYPLRGFCVAVLFAFSWHATLSSVIGMEPGLFVLLMLCALLLQQYQRWYSLSLVFAVLACMTRPEGALLVLAIVGVRVAQLRKVPIGEFFPAGVLLASYLCFLQYYFGSVLPHAGMAKSIAYYREPLQALQGLADHIVILTFTPFFDSPHFLAKSLAYVLWGLSGFGFLYAARQSAAFAMLGLTTFGILALYLYTNPLLFEWYVVPLEPGYLFSMAWGVVGLGSWLRKGGLSYLYYAGATVLFMVLLVFAALRYELPEMQLSLEKGRGYRYWPLLAHAPHSWHSPLPVLSPQRRETVYIELARSIEPEVTKDTVVLAPEYGAFGYHSSAKMLSSIGHTTKEMFPFLPVPREQVGYHINNSISREMVEAFKPDYVMSLEVFIRENLLKSQKFLSEYELLTKRPSPVFGSKGIYLFKRKQSASSATDVHRCAENFSDAVPRECPQASSLLRQVKP